MLEIRNYSPNDDLLKRILERGQGADEQVRSSVTNILAEVKSRGDDALVEFGQKFDNVDLSSKAFAVTDAEYLAAEQAVSDEFLIAIAQARTNIRRFHEYQKRSGYVHDDGEGVLLSKKVMPLARVGVYVPGGTAPLFSSVLMNVIPAQVAGVPEILLATPPRTDGSIDPHILTAAKLLGVTAVYKVGGAQAVAAFAFGTESIPRVDKVVGPGNAYVTEAKRQVFGCVGIDSVAGPSELVVICDKDANPRYVAADLLSQVEHGSGLEAGVVLTNSRELADAVCREAEVQLAQLSRAKSIRAALSNYGGIFVCESLAQAVEAANLLAPEHLEIQTRDPQQELAHVKNAGAIFLGAASTEPVGDYFCGTNHVLPTGGAARYSSSLSVTDFQKDTSVIQYSGRRLDRVGRHIIRMADLEGLTAHANAVRVRLEEREK